MSTETSDEREEESQSWLQKGMATIVRMGRVSGISAAPKERGNPLRDLFSDLIAYVILFDASCEQSPPPLTELREKIVAMLTAQETQAQSIGVSQESFRDTRFAVLSWVDEIILNSAWPQRSQWQHLMLKYYGTLNAGEEFFRRLEALPSQANDAREIYFICLALGFQGQYAFGSDQRELKDLKQRHYKHLCASSGDIRQNYPRLFPEAYQKATLAAQAKEPKRLVWYISAISVPIVLFLCFWFILSQKADQIIARIGQPQLPGAPAWNTCIVDTLTRRNIPAEDTTKGVVITLASVLRFQVNSPELSPEALTLVNEIVAIVKQCKSEDRSIVVEGHASKDGNPVLNRDLSDKRARNVAEAFARAGFRRERISAWGSGSDRPKPGATDAENRRVEITIAR